MRYTVVEAKSKAELTKEVNVLTTKGWVPQGGVCVVLAGNAMGSWWYFQALTLVGTEKPAQVRFF